MAREHIIKLLKGTQSQIENESLNIGELVFATDTKLIFISDGIGKLVVSSILLDVLANRPIPFYKGRAFLATDTGNFYIDTGTLWYQINLGSGSNISNIIQVRGSSLNVNVGGVSIPWIYEDIKDSYYTRSNTIDPQIIRVSQTGLYKITYSLCWETSTDTRRNIATGLWKNYSTIILGSESYAYARNQANRLATNNKVIMTSLIANDYITLEAWQEGESGDAYTFDGQSSMIVEFIR